MSNDWETSAFEDPAPKKSAGSEDLFLLSGSEKSSKRRLRYRADVEVSGPKYRGRKISRLDAGLDSRSIGLFDDHDNGPDEQEDTVGGDEEEDGSNVVSVGNTDDEEGSTSVDHEGNEDLQQSDFPIRSNTEKDSLLELEKEERAIAERLATSKRIDGERASAVRSQKAVYDAAVNFRIRLEPLISLSRTFPSSGQRSSGDAWSTTEVSSASQETLNSMQSLVDQSEAALTASWPTDQDKTKHKDFEKWRDSVLNHWGRKVADASGDIPKGGFMAFDTSVTAQMKAALASGKHLERTQRVRESLTLLDGHSLEPGLCESYFDDGEFYRTLLREIIESGEAPGGGLRYAQLSKSGRVKKKRGISFAKGKRIKYDVHEKMVGFLPSIPLPDPGPVDEIITNLFGGDGRVATDNKSN